MDKILVVCSSEKGRKVYTDNLKDMGYIHVDTENNSGAARRRILVDEYNMVIIDTPLTDEFGNDLAIKIAEGGTIGVILMVKSESADMISAKVEDYGVFVISKPFTKSIFYQGVKFVFTSLRRFRALKKEQSTLKRKVEDIKRIDRAKCLLIQYNNITEEEAHRVIEKYAMNERITRREVADKIIKRYGV